jgi:transcriptional regulator with XRE-family HTH domain
MDRSPLQRERERRGWTQEHVADQLRRLGLEHGHQNLGIDANAVSRHERGIIALPRDPYPALYAILYGTTLDALWPIIDGMERRRFLGVLAAAPVVSILPGGADLTTEAVTAVTGGFRRLEATTAASELRAPVVAHLRFIAGQLDHGGTKLAAAASEAAGFTAWLAVDQGDDEAARRHYAQAIADAERSGSALLVAYMLGSMSLWAAETGNAGHALRLVGQAQQRLPRAVPPAVRAWTAVIEATAHASARDTDTAFAALERADRAVEQSTKSQ